MAEEEGWIPKSKEDWAEVFAMGLGKDREEQAKIAAEESQKKQDEEEAEAKRLAENPPKEEPPAPKPTFGSRLLGIKTPAVPAKTDA